MRSCPEFSSTESGWVCLFCDYHLARTDMGGQPVEPAHWPPMSALAGEFSSKIHSWYVENSCPGEHKQELLLLSA